MICIVRGEKADAPVCSPHCDLSAAIRLAAAMEARGPTVRTFEPLLRPQQFIAIGFA